MLGRIDLFLLTNTKPRRYPCGALSCVGGVKYRTFLYYLKKAGWTKAKDL